MENKNKRNYEFVPENKFTKDDIDKLAHLPLKGTFSDDLTIDVNMLKDSMLYVIPNPNKIRNYKIINNTVVIFTFADGTEIKTVCNPNDKFDLHEAAKIAICKKKFGGTKEYNNALRNAIRQVDDVTKKKANEIAEEKRIAKRKAKYAERQAKRKEKKRQAQIDMQKEAFLKAMLAYDDIMAERAAAPDENVSDDVNE